jgi:acetoacetyl-CoA reductase/3-oxoacyl-[acyl-carrier protein] reductase
MRSAALTEWSTTRPFGRPEEIAGVVHFLCADASSYITGQVWAVNGGMDM